MKRLIFVGLPVVIGLVVLYFVVVMNWNYSSGERAGWVQKFSKKGWVCKTWEGELAMVSMPGTTQEKFYFTVWDESVAKRINEAMGRRVSLHYEEKVGLPSTCFGETLHWVSNITIVPEIPLAPGIVVPVPPAAQPPGTQPPMTPPPVAQPPVMQPAPVPPPGAQPQLAPAPAPQQQPQAQPQVPQSQVPPPQQLPAPAAPQQPAPAPGPAPTK